MCILLFLSKTLSKAVVHSLLPSHIHLTPVVCMNWACTIGAGMKGGKHYDTRYHPSEILKYREGEMKHKNK